ncbi:MAG: initiation control protein YabA [Anaerolineae bacterium]
MVSDNTGKRLHDRATRGEELSEEEQAQLEAWYAIQDRAEADELGLTGLTEAVAALEVQIDSALTQLATVIRRIQELTEENQALRRENAALRRQLAQRALSQPA